MCVVQNKWAALSASDQSGKETFLVWGASARRWVAKYVPLLDQQFRARKRPVGSSGRLDETYVKVKGNRKNSVKVQPNELIFQSQPV
jgi:hypothetical protein